MASINEQDFIAFLEETLMAEEPLHMDEKISEDIFDSTGRLLTITAFDKQFGIKLTIDAISKLTTPRDLYELLG